MMGVAAWPRATEAAETEPAVFWASDRLEPGHIAMLYGGALGGRPTVRVWRVEDGDPGQPGAAHPSAPAGALELPALQSVEESLKFQIPAGWKPGLFAAQAGGAAPVVMNRPEIWFAQPTTLAPGLDANEAPPEGEVQIIGKGFTVPGAEGPARVSVRAEGEGSWLAAAVTSAEPYSLVAKLPPGLAEGGHELCVHNGCGGGAGWSAPLRIQVRKADVWPDRVFNVKQFGAAGNDVQDDTEAIRKALAAARENGGGVVWFPYGTYRLTQWIAIPERTVLRGAGRDLAVLKWPVTEPTKSEDFTKAAIFAAAPYAIEDLTIIVRKVDYALFDLSYEIVYNNSVPAEVTPLVKPWGRYQDVFLRRVMFQHWLLAGHPENQPALAAKYWGGAYNFIMGGGRNVEVSDCVFMGGHQQFNSLRNSRVVRNSFSNSMGYCWTALGGGAHYAVCTDNEIRASSSWGWGWTGMQYVYSARNVSRNFVRGEREAMTLDVSALPTARPVSQYWGSPVEVGNAAGQAYLKFPPPDQVSADGFRTGFTPGCFRGGQAIIHAYEGGPGARQTRNIVDNSEDTVFLDRPFTPAPDTQKRRLYIEIAPRHARAHIGTTCWVGRAVAVEAQALTGDGAQWIPQEFVGMTALILDGKGVGQYRVITANTADRVELDRPWAVAPDGSSVIGIWSLMRHMIVYQCEGYDTSAFAQLYGSFYEYIVDSCKVERNQGMWGQSGWFVQMRNNDIAVGVSYHPGIGSAGSNPERNLPYAYTGLTEGRLRITKSIPFQYSAENKVLFVDDVMGKTVPGAIATTLRGNRLRYNERLTMGLSTRDAGGARFRDVVIDSNRIAFTPVGVQLDPNVYRAVLNGNQFEEVAEPYAIQRKAEALILP